MFILETPAQPERLAPVTSPTSASAVKGAAYQTDFLLACGASLSLAIASCFVFHFANLQLFLGGASISSIGASASIQALGIVIAAPFTSVIGRVIGCRSTVLLGALCCVVATFMMTEEAHLIGWGAARALLAIGIAFVYTTNELLMLKQSGSRRTIGDVGIYASLIAAGTAIGPLLLSVTGVNGASPILFAAALFIIPVLLLWRRLSNESEQSSIKVQPAFLSSYARIWPALVAVFVFGFLDSGGVGMLPLHGFSQGYTAPVALAATVVAASAGILFQYPIAKIANRINACRALSMTAISVLLCVVVISQSSGHPIAMLGAAFLFGGLSDGFYTVALVLLAVNLTGAERVGGTACLISICGLGEALGPVATGAGMSIWGPLGLPLVISLLLIPFILVLSARRRIISTPRMSSR